MFKFEQKPAEKVDYIVGSTWSTLNKSWREYRKAEEVMNILKMKLYANKIKNLQNKLGLKESKFSNLDSYPDPLYK